MNGQANRHGVWRRPPPRPTRRLFNRQVGRPYWKRCKKRQRSPVKASQELLEVDSPECQSPPEAIIIESDIPSPQKEDQECPQEEVRTKEAEGVLPDLISPKSDETENASSQPSPSVKVLVQWEITRRHMETSGAQTRNRPVYSKPLMMALNGELDIGSLKTLKNTFLVAFSVDMELAPKGGHIRTYFNYLLMDPRITQNLPVWSRSTNETEKMGAFVKSIFYVGKATHGRPYDHLREAGCRKRNAGAPDKYKKIWDIWDNDFGVVVLRCCDQSFNLQALTQEAAIIDALGVENLSNLKRGEYHGQVARWSPDDKCRLGVVLLDDALQSFLRGGEIQLRPKNLGRPRKIPQ